MLITVQPRPFVVALGFQMKKSYEKLLPLLSLVFLEGSFSLKTSIQKF